MRRLRWRAIRDQARESLLFLPGVMLVGSVLIGIVLGELDQRHADEALPLAFTFSPDVAVTLLGTIAGAMITTAGVVFSLMVISLQLASGQFSPRVLRSFWRDRYGQVLVGLLLSTFAFCVLALARVDTSARAAPPLTVGFAMLLTLASVVAIVFYLNRISRQQYVGRIMERVLGETLRLIGQLPYGRHIGVRVGDAVPAPDPATLGPGFVVRGHVDGWVQQISKRAVVAAVPPGSVVRLETRVGAYLVRETPLATVWPVPPAAVQRAVARLVAEAAILGPARTMQQDIDFGLRQLLDIALRALSPAVNDPTTAIEVIVRLGSIMRPLLIAELPAQSVRDPHGRILLTPWDLDHVEYVRHAFSQLRVYAAPHAHVLIALVRTLRMLRAACSPASERSSEASDAVHSPASERSSEASDAVHSTVDGREAAVAELDHQLELALQGCAQAGLLPQDRSAVEAAAR